MTTHVEAIEAAAKEAWETGLGVVVSPVEPPEEDVDQEFECWDCPGPSSECWCDEMAGDYGGRH